MSGLAWIAFAGVVVVLAARMVLSEAVWPGYRVETRPRRVVRGLDVLTALLVLVLVVALAGVIGPALLQR